MKDSEAYEAMLRHHALLRAGVEGRTGALRRAVDEGTPFGPRAAELLAYLGEEVLPHALAEEETIYAVAATHPELAATVEAMTAEHVLLGSLVDGIASAEDAASAAAKAGEISSLFASHVAKENDVLLPALAANEDVHLAEVLGEMHRLTEAPPTSRGGGTGANGEEAELLSLLLEAAAALAATGEADHASRLAAAAWRTLRPRHPDLAARVTTALHSLARSAQSRPVTFVAGDGNTDPAGERDLDVRNLVPAHRHEAIFAAYEALAPGGGFVLVNDHDPKPLRYQFEAEHPGQFTWDYLEAGPRTWRVRIGRALALSAR